VLPIRLQQPYNPDAISENRAYDYFGILVTTNGEAPQQYIIPLAIRFCGSQSHPPTDKLYNKVDKHWEISDNQNSALFAKFNNHALLRCIDTEVCMANVTSSAVTWTPRRFAVAFDVAARISCTDSILQAIGPTHMDNNNFAATYSRKFQGWERYTSVPRLTAKLLQVCCPVRFKAAKPWEPFDVVPLESFDFVAPTSPTSVSLDRQVPLDEEFEARPEQTNDMTEIPPLDDETRDQLLPSMHYNDKKSCAAHYCCPYEPCTYSDFCLEHHAIALEAWNSFDNEERAVLEGLTKPRGWHHNIDFQDTIIFSPPTTTGIENFRVLHQHYNNRILWAVDVEFGTLRGVNAVPYAILIRNVRDGALILSTSVDYDGINLDEMEHILAAHQGDRGTSVWTRKSYFMNFYNGVTTNGMSLSAVGRFLRTAGFSIETHTLLSWYTMIDMYVVCRALLGHDQLLDSTLPSQLTSLVDQHRKSIQPFDIARMMGRCTDLGNLRLGYVFRSMFLIQRQLRMHDPDNNTLAMVQILHVAKGRSEKWTN
jgi:hypothetical protein